MNKNRMDVFDYQTVTVDEKFCSQYRDGYEKFGWKIDENMQPEKNKGKITLHMKRNRHIVNKVELIRLQKHYEACMEEIKTLENSKNSVPAIFSLTCGLCGCGFMAGSVFAVTSSTPIIWLTIVLAIPGFLLWGAAGLFYKRVRIWRTKKIEPVIEVKYDEMYEVCKKAYGLL